MGWDKGGRYYTRSKRVNGRVVREYIGGGRAGAIVARFDAIERDQRLTERECAKAERDDVAALDAPLADHHGDDLAVREAVHAKLGALRAELLGADPPPVERLLVERVVACWLQVQDAELRYAQNQTDMTVKQADFHQRRMDATNRRYLAALRTLAAVRKLAVPALRIHPARKQVNVAAAHATVNATAAN